MWLIILTISLFSMLLGNETIAAPITFNTALPVSRGEYIFREQFVVNKSSDDPSNANRDRTELSAVSVLGYGVTPDLAIFGAVPYTDRELDTNAGTRSAKSLGDAKLFGRYTVYSQDSKGKTFRIAPFAGVKAPTGDDNKKDSSGILPASVQAGSGSWDIFGGLVATYASLDYNIDGQISYQANNEGSGREAGDIARADASVQYRVWPDTITLNAPGFLYGVLETNLIYQDKNETAGVEDTNTGGTTINIVPGFQYAAERWIAELALQIPVVQNLNGTALENDYIARTGFRINF